ncbi:MAG: peptidylprolyl isomerase [Candidatus Cloacimonetes bacterium]|nr:peptidylprolyl isomerase [Candidatus Cloacimonadota bacterium]
MKRMLAVIMLLSLIVLPLCATSYAEWQTSMGMFRCELYEELVPITANNFMDLANAEFYDGCIFHRVIDDFMIQDGDPTGTGYGGPGYAIPDEFHPDLVHDSPGVLSMANAGPNTGGSQYFITLAPTPWLNGAHAIFGHVIEGMDVVFDIGAVPTDENDRPITPVVINTIRIFDFQVGGVLPEDFEITLEVGVEEFFVVQATGIENDPTFAWTVDGEPAGTLFFIYHTFTQPGEHEVICTVSDGTYDLDFTWQVDVTGTDVDGDTPLAAAPLLAWPNPFNPSTTIGFGMPKADHARLDVFNVRGRRVATLLDEHMPAGTHSVTWTAEGLASGVYFARLNTPAGVKTTKLLLMK